MRTSFLFLVVLVICFIGNSCRKPFCPEPDLAKEEDFVAILKSEGKEVLVTSQSYLPVGKEKYTIGCYAWTRGGISDTAVTLIDFDLSAIPSGTTLKKATLLVYGDTTSYLLKLGGHFGENAWSLIPVTSSWDTKTISWANQPQVDTLKAIKFPNTVKFDQSYAVDVTGLIQEELKDPDLHHGFMMKQSDEYPYNSILFCSSNHPEEKLRPQLRVEYEKPE